MMELAESAGCASDAHTDTLARRRALEASATPFLGCPAPCAGLRRGRSPARVGLLLSVTKGFPYVLLELI
jgi:hypothetical protein